MKPTDEQLRDPKWWDENAPMGATHFDKDRSMWIKQISHSAWYWDGDWQQYKDQERFEWHMSNAEPRPIKPAAPAWEGGGLPPVGCECEFQPTNDDPWYVVQVIAHFEGSAVFAAGDDYPNGCYDGCSHPENFRPLRTKEKRERDDLASFLTDFFFDDFNETLAPEDIAGAIIAAGWRKKKQDD